MKQYRSHGTNYTRWDVFAAWLASGEAFTNATGTFTGGPVDLSSGALPHYGQMPYGEARRLHTGLIAGKVDYVVYSYKTPIAWHRTDGQWIQPEVKYSTTTSKHQGVVATALSSLKAWSA